MVLERIGGQVPKERLDEKTFNGDLASALRKHIWDASVDAETSGKLLDLPGKWGAQPDITVFRSGRESVLVENKYDDKAESGLAQQCEGRLNRRWADGRSVRAVVGVLTPVRMSATSDVLGAIESASDFRWAAWAASSVRLPESGWLKGSVAALAGFIDRVGTEAADVGQHAATVKQALDSAAQLLKANPQVSAEFGQVVQQQPGIQTDRMAMAVMFNAIVFQSHIARHHPGISSPSQMVGTGRATQGQVLQEWNNILKINYWPIFRVSTDLLGSINNPDAANAILGQLFATADGIAGVPGSQGLVGRIFGELIGDRKFLATYYTLPSSSALLAEMAVDRLDVDWKDSAAVAAVRVADMACGTGALLTAAYSRIAERHLLAGGDPRGIHQPMIEESLVGCDIMPAAVHLTAARLSGEYPDVDYNCTRTWVMLYGVIPDALGGKPSVNLGTLDLQHTNEAPALFGDGSIFIGARGASNYTTAEVPSESLDLVIMNPPFTRATNHESGHGDIPNPAFAGMDNDADAQEDMGKALKRLQTKIKGHKAAHGNAGIASNFVDLAHTKLKPGGVLALVLPVVAISGASWENFRKLLSSGYADIAVTTISSTPRSDGDLRSGPDKTDRAFSADTGMGEVLVVARKLPTGPASPPGQPEHGKPAQGQAAERDSAKRVNFVSLSDRPRSVVEGVEVARAIRQPQLDHCIRMGDTEIGWTVPGGFGPGLGHPSGISNPDVASAAADLADGRLRLPPTFAHPLPIAPLAEFGHAGPVHRDINGIDTDRDADDNKVETPRGPFTITKFADREEGNKNTSRPVLWSHQASEETRLYVLPCSKATVRHDMDADAEKVWEGGYWTRKPIRKSGGSIEDDNRLVAGATRLHISCEFRVTSQPVAACLTPALALGGRAWPSFAVTPPQGADAALWEKALCVWLNTTVGLLGRWWVSSRQQQGRANLTITTLGWIPVIDLRQIAEHQIDKMGEIFDRFSKADFLPANQAHQDLTRQDLDKAVLCGALGLPDEALIGPLAMLRRQWCSEPGNA